MNTARGYLGGCGTQTAGLAFGGFIPPRTGATEGYDGTSWTNSNSINTTRSNLAGAGTQTSALAFGGQPITGATEEYDGTSWTSNPGSMSTARDELAGCGTTQASALGFGGYFPPAVTAATEEWTGAGAPLTKTITVS
jgi:hypothetical protein